MQRVFKIAVNGTNYDVVVEELTSATSAIMPNYTPAPATVSAAAWWSIGTEPMVTGPLSMLPV